MTPDLINAAFEFCAAIAVSLHCRAILHDRQVHGVSPTAVALFVAWGCWNLFYYPHLDQPLSFACGIFVTVANLVYVGLLIRYNDDVWLTRIRRRLTNAAGAVVCRVRGHRYGAILFHVNCLYHCSRCGREMFDRTLADVEPLSDADRELLDRLDNIYLAEGHN
ncbi:MAG: hypothetical protein WAO76_07355 [Georgfuchsia sp.]